MPRWMPRPPVMNGWMARAYRLVSRQAVSALMPTPRILFWHCDLRLADSLGRWPHSGWSAVTGMYVLDPQVINPPEHLPPMAPARCGF